MAVTLQTPSVLPIVPFDPKQEYNIQFTYLDVQSVKNRAVITDNETGNIVYDSTQPSLRLYHTLPANTLLAGKKYLIQIQVFDSDNNSSNLSDSVLFFCLTTPEFSFKNLKDDTANIYKQANITLELLYSQEQNELLKSYRFIQYNAYKVEIASSETIYNKNLSYVFYGLDNNTTYYFRAIGETQNGVSLDTGYIEIDILLTKIPTNMSVQLENDYNNGVVKVAFNIKDIEYVLSDDDYSFADGMLTLNSTTLSYVDGFSIGENFSTILQVQKVALGTFFIMNDVVKLSTLKICDTYYCLLSINGSDFAQYIKLENATITEDGRLFMDISKDYATIILKRNSGYYGLEIM